jgi:hypothetical protein
MPRRFVFVLGLACVVGIGSGAGCGSSGGSKSDADQQTSSGGSTETGAGGEAGSPTAGASGARRGAAGTGAAGASSGAAGARAGAAGTGAAGASTGAAGASTGAAGASTGAAGASTGAAGASTGAAGASSGAAGAAPIGNPGGPCAIPTAAAAVDVSHPTTVVGSGTSASCTADKVVAAVAAGGIVTFSCGAAPITIVVPEMAIINDGGVTKDGSVTLDGGGKVTLSGGGKNRILRVNPCDVTLHYTTPHCNNQDTPHLVVQNIGFTAGAGLAEQVDQSGVFGGGALYVGGGTFKAVNVTFTNNRQTNAAGQLVQDLGGGAIYSVDSSTPGTVYVVNCTFDGNSGINGGALGSIGTSWTILNSVFKNNSAVGHGLNPAQNGTEGGGLGGAIYNDGDGYTLTICGTQFLNNQANEIGSGAIFEVVDNLQGNLAIDQTTFTGNSDNGDVQQGAKHPGIYVEARNKVDGTSGVTITSSTFN